MGGVVGGILGLQQASEDRNAASDARRQALQQWTGINVPSIYDQELNFDQYQNAGDFQAALEAAIAQDPSLMSGVSTDPRLQQAQMDALSKISQMGETGLLPGEEAALRQARRSSAGEAQAKSGQILDNFARRGMGGSGNELAAQLQSAQSSADRQSQESDRLMQMAQERALSAIGQQGSLAGQIRNQSFGEKSDVAKAQDAINSFNTANQQQVQARNTSSTNTAALRNLNNTQNLSHENTQLRNQQQEHNKGLIQQQFNNQTNLAAGKSGQYAGVANASDNSAARTANMWAGIGQGVDSGIGAYNQYQNNQANKKKSDEDDLVNEFNSY